MQNYRGIAGFIFQYFCIALNGEDDHQDSHCGAMIMGTFYFSNEEKPLFSEEFEDIPGRGKPKTLNARIHRSIWSPASPKFSHHD